MKSGIYMILNISNNKSYIGSSKNITRRKREHFNLLENNKHKNKYLQYSFNKYKKEMFIFTILEECKIEDLIFREIYWINFKDSTNTKKGYNLSVPKENGGYEMTDITKEKLRRLGYEQKHGVIDENIYNDWKEGKKEFKNRELIDQRKKVLAFDSITGELKYSFNSVADTARFFNTRENMLTRVLDNPTNTLRGYTLVREENYIFNKVYKKKKKESRALPKILKGPFLGNPIETFNLETLEIIKRYNNRLELAEEYNSTPHYITKVLCNQRKSYRGMGVRYS